MACGCKFAIFASLDWNVDDDIGRVVAAMNRDELRLLTLYLPCNLNVDEASFRRQLVTSVHAVLTRLRDSSLLLLRRNATADVSEAFGQWHCL